MIYKAFLKQRGDGCDYTIGCAQKIVEINAQNNIEAKQKLFEEILENYTDERELESCELYIISEVMVCDLKQWYKIIEDIQENNKDSEFQEYQRLKLKFEN